MTTFWEASLFGQITGQSTLERLLKRLEAIGCQINDYQLYEKVYKPLPEALIEPPMPSMKPVQLRLQRSPNAE